MTLTEFLTARLNEDEAAARETLTKRPDPVSRAEFLAEHEISDAEVVRRAAARRIAFHDTNTWLVGVSPHRVLAEVEAKRQLINRVEQHAEFVDAVRETDSLRYDRVALHLLAPLALPYADHPDYDEAWRP